MPIWYTHLDVFDGIWRLIFPVFVTGVLLVGCDTSVRPIAPSDQYHYSIFGVLNPAQDTQWVRVESLGAPTSEGGGMSLAATVSLHNMETDETWTLTDSLMIVEGEQHHNFWTTARIAPSTTYQLTVQGPDNEVAQATTTTPSRPPSITVEDPIRLPCIPQPEANTFIVTLTEVKELAGVKMKYFQSVFGPNVSSEFDHYDDTIPQGSESYTTEVNYRKDLQRAQRTMERECLADSAKVIAASGGPDWPAWDRYSTASIPELARPDSFSNVQGGHGLWSGIFTTQQKVPIRQRDLQ